MTSSLQNAFSPLYLTWVYWVLWVWSSLPLERKDETQRGRHTVTGGALSAQLPSHPYPKLPHGACQPSQVHTHTRFHICSTARALVFPKSTHNRHPRPHTPSCQVINCTSTAHTGQERREPTWDRRLEISLLLHTQNLYQTFPAMGTCNAMPKPPRQHTGINSTPSPAAAQGSDYTDVQPPPGPGLLGAQHSSAIESKPSSLTRD